MTAKKARGKGAGQGRLGVGLRWAAPEAPPEPAPQPSQPSPELLAAAQVFLEVLRENRANLPEGKLALDMQEQFGEDGKYAFMICVVLPQTEGVSDLAHYIAALAGRIMRSPSTVKWDQMRRVFP